MESEAAVVRRSWARRKVRSVWRKACVRIVVMVGLVGGEGGVRPGGLKRRK